MIRPEYIAVILACFSLLGAVVALFLFLKPALAIKWQQKFYSRINWRMEPIDMGKELRTTKAMGFFLLTVSLIGLVKLLLKANK